MEYSESYNPLRIDCATINLENKLHKNSDINYKKHGVIHE